MSEWISVNDRLPERNMPCLVCIKEGDDYNASTAWIDMDCYDAFRRDWVDHFDFEVTHWMPLPDKPKGE